MFDLLRRWGHAGGVVMEAISGVDCALWDLAGKAEGLPVWRLLRGMGRERVPVYASSVYIDSDDVMVAQAQEQVAAGFGAVKVKIGRGDGDGGFRADLRAIVKIREALGSDVDLMVDANGAFDAATAIRVGRALESCDVTWFEEPVPPDDLDGYRRVHAMTTTPLAAGETAFGVIGFKTLIADGLIDYVQPDLGRCGGMTAAMQISALAFAHNRRVAPHTGFSGGLSQLAALHLAVATPELFALEYMFIDNPAREIFTTAYPRPRNGELAAPEGPGWGLDPDLERVKAMTR
jgi:L-alanine-DL-glutamate epimerase-like enolase superfamily enzyme